MENSPKIVTLTNGEILVGFVDVGEHNVQLYKPVKVENFRVQTENGFADATSVKKWIAYSSDEYYNISTKFVINISNLREDLVDKYVKFTDNYNVSEDEENDEVDDELDNFLSDMKEKPIYLH